MLNTPILITGCQRSGTTLLSLILDSHPEVTGIDEMQFQRTKVPGYLNNPALHPFVAWKLPVAAHSIDFIKAIPNIKVLWCVRDPRDVVASMLNLPLKLPPVPVVPWAAHPAGALQEISNCYHALGKNTAKQLEPALRKYQRIAQKTPTAVTRSEATHTASLCWRLKNDLPALYRRQNIGHLIVRYETLIQNPESIIREILEFSGLHWHENVLKHHQLHKGVSVGNTDNTRAIDSKSVDKWRKTLTEEDLTVVTGLCNATAEKYGYHIN